MTFNPLGKIPKAEAEQYQGKRKLLLVPTFPLSRNAPQEGHELLASYWGEVREQVEPLGENLGGIAHVYHEGVYAGGDTGLKLVESVNPKGYALIHSICTNSAKLEAAEDRALVEEANDWQRCVAAGLVTEKVKKTAIDGFREATRRRHEHMGRSVGETLGDDESGLMVVREDHGIQFEPDIQVFFIAPRSLDAMKRWIGDQMRARQQQRAH